MRGEEGWRLWQLAAMRETGLRWWGIVLPAPRLAQVSMRRYAAPGLRMGLAEPCWIPQTTSRGDTKAP